MEIFNRRGLARRCTVGLGALAVGGLALAGCHRPSTVEGIVWFDDDLDGVRDPGEAPAAGVRVSVECHYTDPDVFTDGVCDTAMTDDDGRYRLFVRVDRSGDTQGLVRFEPPAGLRAVEPPGVSWSFRFSHDEQRDSVGIDAALVDNGTGSLGDQVWRDDGDGIQEAGEPGMADLPVELQAGSGQVVASTITGPDGRYLFTEVPNGRYTVRFGPLPAGFRFTRDGHGPSAEDSDANPYSGRAPVTVQGGRAELTVDAGVVPAEAGEIGIIGDRAWSDRDADGIQDSGEPGEAGVEVLLVGANTGQLSSTFTDADGHYSFLVSRAITPDQPYRLVFVAPPGRQLSPPDVGADDTVDSDADPATSATSDFTLQPDEVDTSRDAGIGDPDQPPATLGDLVWDDTDGDGIHDGGEPGVAAVAISLIGESDTVIATAITDGDGHYRFPGLSAGQYTVRFELPGGFMFSPADQGGDDSVDSDADPNTGQTARIVVAAGVDNLDVDAGIRALPTGGATIGDFAWRDLDHDGVQDSGEPGLPNLEVLLLDQQGALVATTSTEDGGLYGFANVEPGSYRLRFGFPPGLLPTTSNAGNDDTIDSDINGGGETPLIVLADGQVDATVDAGFAPPA